MLFEGQLSGFDADEQSRDETGHGDLEQVSHSSSLLCRLSGCPLPQRQSKSCRDASRETRVVPEMPPGNAPTSVPVGLDAPRGVIVFGQEDLAELAVDELLEIQEMDEEQAKQLIMAARAPWFE